MVATLEKSKPDLNDVVVPDGYEMVDGRLVEMMPMSERSSWVGGQLFAAINAHCKANDLGRAYPQDTPFRGFPGRRISVRKPDASFVRKDRLAAKLSNKDLTIVPDLAVEVISPTDVVNDLYAKVEQYQAAGVRLVWVIDPISRLARIHRVDGTEAKINEHQDLDGEDVLPGFRCSLQSILPPPGEDESED